MLAAATAAVLNARHALEEVVFWSACGGFVLGAPLGAWAGSAPVRMARWLVRPPQVAAVLAILAGVGYIVYDSFRAKSVDELVAQAMLPDRPGQGYQDRQRFRLREAAWKELRGRGAPSTPRLIEATEQRWNDPTFDKVRMLQTISETPSSYDRRCTELLVRLIKESPGSHPQGWETGRDIAMYQLAKMGPRARGSVPALLEQIDDPNDAGIQPRTQKLAFQTLLKIDPSLASHPVTLQFLETYAARAEDSDPEQRRAAIRALAELKKSLPQAGDAAAP
jgi:hypothetical protein